MAKTFTQFLSEQKIPPKFEDSVDATEFMDTIHQMIKSKALKDWAKLTDQNYDTQTVSKLDKLRSAMLDFLDEIDKAQ